MPNLWIKPEVPRSPKTHMIEEFSDYMREENGLSLMTVHKRGQHVTQFSVALMNTIVLLMRSPFSTSTRLSLAKASRMLTPAHR
jgi:hypothetical protein